MSNGIELRLKTRVKSEGAYNIEKIWPEFSRDAANDGGYPLNPDADEDGLSDTQELLYGTSPDNKDTDFDGLM